LAKLTKQEQERLNYSMPVANDVKLGDIIVDLQASSGGGTIDAYTKTETDAKFQAKGNYAKVGDAYTKSEADAKYSTKTALDDLAKRVTALEAKNP